MVYPENSENFASRDISKSRQTVGVQARQAKLFPDGQNLPEAKNKFLLVTI
jgi:hypothetical protein